MRVITKKNKKRENQGTNWPGTMLCNLFFLE